MLLEQVDLYNWIVRQNVTVTVETSQATYSICVCEGFETDLGSIPRALWNIFPPHEYSIEYIIHDWLYESESVTRALADWILLELLTLRCRWAKRNTIYLACRAFGSIKWRAHKKEKIEAARKKGFLMVDIKT